MTTLIMCLVLVLDPYEGVKARLQVSANALCRTGLASLLQYAVGTYSRSWTSEITDKVRTTLLKVGSYLTSLLILGFCLTYFFSNHYPPFIITQHHNKIQLLPYFLGRVFHAVKPCGQCSQWKGEIHWCSIPIRLAKAIQCVYPLPKRLHTLEAMQ